jgi:hypothetical protein
LQLSAYDRISGSHTFDRSRLLCLTVPPVRVTLAPKMLAGAKV